MKSGAVVSWNHANLSVSGGRALQAQKVRASCKGRVLGRRLLEQVHAMSREHPDSRGVSLTTESAGNVAFYERLGYRIVGHDRVEPRLESWGFFRAD